jgi:hypothetical protein
VYICISVGNKHDLTTRLAFIQYKALGSHVNPNAALLPAVEALEESLFVGSTLQRQHLSILERIVMMESEVLGIMR